MSYQPPFTITPQILNLVASISEQVGKYTAIDNSASSQRRKQNRIRAITGTLAIEGNTLTEEQITAIVDGKAVLGSVAELAEVQGAIKAYQALNTLNPFYLEDLLHAHQLMMGDILKNAGSFRQKSVGIHKGKHVVHVAPPAHQVSGLMSELIQWLSETDAHPLISSCIFHYEFEFIHPFTDGNGRMGRLWQTLLLAQWQPLFVNLPLESVIKDNQQSYYNALEAADNQAESTPFLEFMLIVILQTLNAASETNAPANAPVNIAEMKTPDAILFLLNQTPTLTRQQLSEQLHKDVRTIGRAIKKLQEQGKLARVGSDKSGYWRTTNSTNL